MNTTNHVPDHLRQLAKSLGCLAEIDAELSAVCSLPPQRSLGIVGADIPCELVSAAGFFPKRLLGTPGTASPRGDALLGKRIDGRVRCIFEDILNGVHADLCGILIGHDNHSYLQLFYVLRALRLQSDDVMPQLHFCDFLHGSYRGVSEYNEARLRELMTRLEEWSERSLQAGSIQKAIESANEMRMLTGRLLQARSLAPPRLSGSQALTLRLAPGAVPAPKLIPALRVLLRHRDTQPEIDGVRVFLTGSAHDHGGVFETIERRGAVVVGEDIDEFAAGTEFEVRAAKNPVAAMAERLNAAPSSSATSTIAKFAARTVELAIACRAERVICVVRNGDAAPRWDVSDQERNLRARGIPFLLIDNQDYCEPPSVEFEERCAQFIHCGEGSSL